MDDFFIAQFSNDNNVKIKLPKYTLINPSGNSYSDIFKKRDNHEVMFRRIVSYLITNKIITKNIIDLGAWIGDNSIPWAMNLPKDSVVYAIDPSAQNIKFINSICEINEISNLHTLVTAISDKNEKLFTNNNLYHAQFSSDGGVNSIDAVSLDYLFENGKINNIEFIHLDVEGYESKVIKGASNIMTTFRPIIAIEQHLESDDYLGLSNHIESMGYSVYLINEILPGCRLDCRNFIAFPNEMHCPIDKINDYLEKKIILPLVSEKNSKNIAKIGIIYGKFMTGNNYLVKGLMHPTADLILYPVIDDNYTKIIATDHHGKWIDGRYVHGCLDISTAENVTNIYDNSIGIIHSKESYNIRFEV